MEGQQFTIISGNDFHVMNSLWKYNGNYSVIFSSFLLLLLFNLQIESIIVNNFLLEIT